MVQPVNASSSNRPPVVSDAAPDFVKTVTAAMLAGLGDTLPVSALPPDGTWPMGTTRWEKRNIAEAIPIWKEDLCTQCNHCVAACPHSAIRAKVVSPEALDGAPESLHSLDVKSRDMRGQKYVLQVAPEDCTGCNLCVEVCPAKDRQDPSIKAINMMSRLEHVEEEKVNYDFFLNLPEIDRSKLERIDIRTSQLITPLFEYSGACSGCGETPYAKLVTQLFGDRMFIANATGCSSIWGASAPATPYTKNKKGYGPAWQNSLFEDNAEFGLGMALGQKAIRNRLIEYVEGIQKDTDSADLKTACQNYLDTVTDSTSSRPATDALIAELEKNTEDTKVGELVKKTLVDKDELAKKSMWIFGGDGWAYDIGFGGLDHVIASGENVNILVFDTEVYSNTGGQASKATPVGSVAQFAAAGKAVKKKDLAAIAMSYGYVYVAQCAMGADNNQVLKAMVEAESYNGPSLVICYAPCINHGIKGGMGIAQLEEKKAVEAGYWNIFRYDPRLADEGKNPFMLDGKAPSASYRDFIMGEVRYNALSRQNPERAKELFAEAKANAEAKYNRLKEMSDK